MNTLLFLLNLCLFRIILAVDVVLVKVRVRVKDYG
jgi:hypothetical protein